MCCNSRSPTAATVVQSSANDDKSSQVAGFTESTLATPLPDGYWVETFPFSKNDTTPDLIAYGLGFEGAPSIIRLFVNPKNRAEPGTGVWGVSEIASLEFPVGMTHADLTGNGLEDVIIIDRYGPSMSNLWDAETRDGGRIIWLQNPGTSSGMPYWKASPIGNSTGMHRVKAGHFTRSDVVQVMGLPIIARSDDLTSPAPILIFTPSYSGAKSDGPTSWTKEVAFASEFRLIHDVVILPRSNGDLDMALVAGKEGVVSLWFDVSANEWKYNVVGKGLQPPQDAAAPKYLGSGSVDVCRVDDDSVGYIATCEAFHGNIISVYTKRPNAPKGPESLKKSEYWTRVVIDDYGPVNSAGTGTVHHVATVHGEVDGIESFAIACMGAPIGIPENQGVYLYRPVDLAQADFKKAQVSPGSAGRLAVAAFSTPMKVDIASLSYHVPGYHTGPDPSELRLDSFIDRSTLISATRLDNEVLLRVPRPGALTGGSAVSLPFWEIGGKKLTLVVIPPNKATKLDDNVHAIKVIYGEVNLTHTIPAHRRLAPAARIAEDTSVRGGDSVTPGENGAIFVALTRTSSFQGPFSTMSQVVSANTLPHAPGVTNDARNAGLPFIKVDQLAWASSGLWDDFEFYNAVGFHVFFNDDTMDKICHIQAWTLGIGETARFHNHYDQSFCEIHYCLSNGGGSGGMRYFPDNYTKDIDTDLELTKEYVEENSQLIVVYDMHEHGPLWKIQPGFDARPVIRPNATVDYPWHAWLASGFGEHKLPIKPPLDPSKQKYDVWLAFEFPPSMFQY